MLNFCDDTLYGSFLQVYILRGYTRSLHALDCEKSGDDSETLRKAKEAFYKKTYSSGGECIGCQIRKLTNDLLAIENEHTDCLTNTLRATLLLEEMMRKEEGDEGS